MKTARIGGVELAIITGIALSNVDDPNAELTRFLDQLDGPIQHPTFKLIFHCAVTVARRIRERILEIDENKRGFARIEMRFKRWQFLGLRFCCDTQQCRQRLNASRNMGLVATLSARALKVAGNCFRGFFHQ